MNLPIDDSINKSKIAVVVVGYNRLHSISRLLNSLLKANYPGNDIPLVISIDCSNDLDLYKYVRSFEWPFGDKYVYIHEKRLGLKDHIFSCGDMTRYFKAIILLEDDLYVSTEFYEYVCLTVDKYQSDSRIAGISLYKNETNGFVGLPFTPLNNGFDVFALQDTSTWGECWTESMWISFRQWLENTHVDINGLEIPEQIKHWKEAWSKYYNAYLFCCDKYFIYPYISLSSNFSDAGVHGGDNNSLLQVSLLYGKKSYNLPDFKNLVVYDGFGNNKNLAKYCGFSDDEICVDLYGNKGNLYGKKYWLSTLQLPFKVEKSFALNMRPIDLNIINNITGKGIFLYNTSIKVSSGGKSKLPVDYFIYHLQGFRRDYLLRTVWRIYFDSLKRKLKIQYTLK